MALLAVQSMPATGLTATYATAAGGGDTVKVTKGLFLHVKNGHSSSQTVTLVTPTTVEGLAVADRAVVVANAAEAMIPVADLYRGSNGLASITYSGVTALTIAAIRTSA